MSDLELGIWRGVRDGFGLIEYPVLLMGQGKFDEDMNYVSAPIEHSTGLTAWPAEDEHKCIRYDGHAAPSEGDLVWYNRHFPDMAGHLIRVVTRIGPGTEFTAQIKKISSVRTEEPRMLLVDIITRDGRKLDHSWIERPDPHLLPGKYIRAVAQFGPHHSEAQQTSVFGVLDPVVVISAGTERPEFGPRQLTWRKYTYSPENLFEVV